MGAFADIGGELFGTYGALIGEALASGDQKKADELRQKAFDEIKNLPIPDIEKEKYQLQFMQAVKAGPSAYDKIDPSFEAAQRRVLQRLGETADAKGMDTQARSALFGAQRQVGREEMAQRDAITSNMQQRGIGGSGLEFASKMANQQAAAERQNMAGSQFASDAARRALEANIQGSNVAGQMYGQQARAADARDMLSRFNAQAQQDANRFNTDTANRQEAHNKDLYGVDYERRRAKARDMYGAYGDQAQNYENKANRKRAIAANTGRSVGGAVGGGMDIYTGGGI